ncbi:hypothetical protein DYB37_005188 [Aphanomyces astaci]|uniref:SAP domain-containing protein n=2 Tax=Aphanomyces astaci TaxID=112090 RepID=A0A397E9G6_APHAT|nr:hypothetical protein DYB36_009052 [Aphanomyces astaci]RHY15355.1 hypothetical protein DYB25_009412 [Aphanomyces astaci]RHY54960.1 hypothetical protein DYB38_010250 [Aphanomyces astaci]RHY74692.1 hypothetical protein DYB30_007636 [Aphanomyces astaci]RHY76830.1 hypothetical protein DYB34_004687 [Aphanomyces astaci]
MSGKGDAAAKKAKSSKRNSLKGGNRKFVTSAEELEARNVVEEVRQEKRRVRRDDGESDDEDDDEEDADGVVFDRIVEEKEDEIEEKKVSKPKGVAGIIQVQNPNFASTKAIKAKDIDPNAEAQPLTRREREAIEKEAKAANYMKRHLAGQTDEAKRDIRRLEEVKKRREDAALRKKQEEEAAAELAKKAAKVSVKGGDDEALDARAIKALKPNALKDHLKERGLSIQGQKNDLIQRLIDYENEKSL